MLRALLVGLLLFTAGPTVTSLALETPAAPTIAAGQGLDWPFTVHLTALEDPTPGTGPVLLTLNTETQAQCGLAEEILTMDPTTGTAQGDMHCNPTQPGTYPLTLIAQSPPHNRASWNGNLTVQPDTLTADLTPQPPDGYRIDYSLTATPDHLPQANLTLDLEAHLEGTNLAFTQPTHAFTADNTTRLDHTLIARHGPGTYRLHAHLDGPRIQPLHLNETIHVPNPDPATDEHDIAVTVNGTTPEIKLTPDSVNANGKTKAPGEELITRFDTTNTTTVTVTLYRSTGQTLIPVHESIHTPDPDGFLEHRFTHPTLPTGTLLLEATAGSASAARTAVIEDTPTTVATQSPIQAPADGRPLTTTLTLHDANFGSTPQDPGPAHGLADIDWTLYHDATNQPAPKWTIQLGPYTGPSDATATTSTLTWPNGTPNATTTNGAITLPLTLDPPSTVTPDTYRLSFYDNATHTLIGKLHAHLPTPPSLTLTAPDPYPGTNWTVNAQLANTTPNTTATLTATLNDEPLANTTINQTTNWTLPLPTPLDADTPLNVTGTLHYPGKPPSPTPDAELQAPIPDWAPTLSLHTALDGYPLQEPVPLHPAGNHTIQLVPETHDPNGDPITVTTTLETPTGELGTWPITHTPLTEIHAPANPPLGRYHANVTAHTPTHNTTHRVPLDAGPLTRIGLTGPISITLEPGTPTSLNLALSNQGTHPLTEAMITLDTAPELIPSLTLNNASLPLGEPFPVDLPPQESVPLNLTLQTLYPNYATFPLHLQAAGGLP